MHICTLLNFYKLLTRVSFILTRCFTIVLFCLQVATLVSLKVSSCCTCKFDIYYCTFLLILDQLSEEAKKKRIEKAKTMPGTKYLRLGQVRLG